MSFLSHSRSASTSRSGNSLQRLLQALSQQLGLSRKARKRRTSGAMALEPLEERRLLAAAMGSGAHAMMENDGLMKTTAIQSGNWFDTNTWDNGVPGENHRAIIGHGVTVELDGADHVAGEIVVHGQLIVPEEVSQVTDPAQVTDGRLRLYVNGTQVDDAPGSQLWAHPGAPGIGGITGWTKTHRGNKPAGSVFGGQIDKTTTHNRALTADEVDTLFAADRESTDGIPRNGIASQWMFEPGIVWTKDTAEGDSFNDHGLLFRGASTDGTLQLDGVDDFVYVRTSPDLNVGRFQEKTISLWFKANDTDGMQVLFEQGGQARGLNVYLDGDTLYAGGWNTPGRESGWKGNWMTWEGIVPGVWNHVVMTLDANGGEPVDTDKTLTTRWMHVNSGGEFVIGTAEDRYDQGTFTLTLTGTDKDATHVIETHGMSDDMHGHQTHSHHMGMDGTMTITANDGFLMTGKDSRVQFYGADKLSFTKLSKTAIASQTSIVVENIIERNFTEGAISGSQFVTSAEDDGQLNWKAGDQIVIASSSTDYTQEEVRTLTKVTNNGDGTSTLEFAEPLQHRHYGAIESYGGENTAPGTRQTFRTREIDMRAEVALLSRNIRIQGLESQDTDEHFGDRNRLQTEDRKRDVNGLSEIEKQNLPETQVANGVGGHIMIMPGSAPIVFDGVQLDRLGQASRKGRYPIHWHLGGDRSKDIFRNSSVTNSNNRGVTIHGTNNLTIEGVVVHDVHGHGFFFEDAVETGNTLVGNLVLGVHTVGGEFNAFNAPGKEDPFVVDTHDRVNENRSRFSSSAAYWITNPNNTFVGNIAAGAGDQRTDSWAEPEKGVAAGTGFWYAIPRVAIGESSREGGGFEDYHPIFETFGTFDYNTSHSTAIGLNFDRGSDLEDAHFIDGVNLNAIQGANQYKPTALIDPANPELGRIVTRHFVDGFTNYQASEAAVYHRGEANTIRYRGLRIADSYNGPWAVSETQFIDSLYVGHSQENSGDKTAEVGGPRLYDGAGHHTDAHFAGFGADSASMFQVEGSSFGPTMYHVFPRVTFEADGTYDNITHAVSDFQLRQTDEGHKLRAPQEWSKAAIDVDGSLTSGAGGGIGYSIVPAVDFLIDDDDRARTPAGWDAYLTDDIYTRIRVQNNDDGTRLFPAEANNPEDDVVSMVFTSQAGEQISVVRGQNNGNLSWTQVAAKADDEGPVEGTFTIEFGEQGLPESGFALNVKNQDGDWIRQNRDLFQRVNNARIVIKVAGGINYTPQGIREVDNVSQLRWERSETVFFRSADDSSVYINTGITDDQPIISFVKTGDVQLQTIFEGRPEASRTIDFGTVIQAEHFDNGTEGVAYHDSDKINTLAGPRDAAVDTTATVVGNIQDGEWLEYTARITGGVYDIGVTVSDAPEGGRIHVLAGTRNDAGHLESLGTIDVPVGTTGNFSSEMLEAIDLAFIEGENSVIRLAFEGNGFEVDSLQFKTPGQEVFSGRPEASRTIASDARTRIELEHFDTGGQNVAYFDKTTGNQVTDGSLRPDEDVDVSFTLVTNDIEDGEWLEYTTNIEAGNYDIRLGKAWGGADKRVKLLIGETNSATVFDEIGEFTFATEEGLTLRNIDLTEWAGLGRVLRLQMVGSSFGLDWIDFTPIV